MLVLVCFLFVIILCYKDVHYFVLPADNSLHTSTSAVTGILQ